MKDDLQLRVRAFVKGTPYTQQEFAQLAGVSIRTLSKVANGHRVTDEMREAIEAALDRLEPLTDSGDPTTLAELGELKARMEMFADQLRDVVRRLDQAGL